VHRDLKPDNVFVTFEGGKPVLKLIDFGIAKLKRAEGQPGAKNLTVAGMLMGTPEYMAPEQAYSAAEVDVRADLYSVGAMMYEMLSGKTPVSGEDPRVVVLKVERNEVTPLVQLVPGIQPEVAGFVHRAMAPRPELRFANATEMRLALDGVASGKRSNTAKLPEVQGVQALPQDGGSTVMGAPAPGALTPPGVGSNRPPPGAVLQQPATGGTMRAEPLAAPPPPPPAAYDAPTRTPPAAKRSGTGLVVGLAALALFLGAGAVVAWVQMNPSTPATPEPIVTTTATPPPTTPGTTTQGTSTTVVTTTPPLTPPPPSPQPQPGHTPSARPSGSAPPIPVPSNSADPAHPIPPIVLPSGFPSAIPLPSGFPSAIPGLPSGFPQFPFPPQPQQREPSPSSNL
jgi:serine/threonine-protein kinase